MLYEYVTGQLDESRSKAIEEIVKEDRETQTALEATQRGLAYIDKLAEADVYPESLQKLLAAENAISLGRRYSKWSEWPETLRWSLTALAISLGVAGLVSVIPWNKLPVLDQKRGDAVIVAQIEKDGTHPEATDLTPDEASEVEAGAEEEMPIQEMNEPHQVAGQINDQLSDQLTGQAGSVPHAGADHSETSGDEHGLPPTTEPAPSQVAGISPGGAQGADSAPSRKEAKPKGFVYRAFMDLANLNELTPKITELVREMGGEKAGEVPLGWRRGTGSYYHFTLPEDNEQKIVERLRAYGPVRISKDPHPRIMPQGQVRFILWIESVDRPQ